jgi:trimeric autotransporter adhesin
MNRLTGLVIAGLVLMFGMTPSWGEPPNPTASDGNFNTAGGTDALEVVGEGAVWNTAFGFNALHNTSGNSNTATGARALSSNTTGEDNTASGHGALYSNTSGIENTANGTAALGSNTTGYFNTASGARALYGNSTGSFNTAYG